MPNTRPTHAKLFDLLRDREFSSFGPELTRLPEIEEVLADNPGIPIVRAWFDGVKKFSAESIEVYGRRIEDTFSIIMTAPKGTKDVVRVLGILEYDIKNDNILTSELQAYDYNSRTDVVTPVTPIVSPSYLMDYQSPSHELPVSERIPDKFRRLCPNLTDRLIEDGSVWIRSDRTPVQVEGCRDTEWIHEVEANRVLGDLSFRYGGLKNFCIYPFGDSLVAVGQYQYDLLIFVFKSKASKFRYHGRLYDLDYCKHFRLDDPIQLGILAELPKFDRTFEILEPHQTPLNQAIEEIVANAAQDGNYTVAASGTISQFGVESGTLTEFSEELKSILPSQHLFKVPRPFYLEVRQIDSSGEKDVILSMEAYGNMTYYGVARLDANGHFISNPGYSVIDRTRSVEAMGGAPILAFAPSTGESFAPGNRVPKNLRERFPKAAEAVEQCCKLTEASPEVKNEISRCRRIQKQVDRAYTSFSRTNGLASSDALAFFYQINDRTYVTTFSNIDGSSEGVVDDYGNASFSNLAPQVLAQLADIYQEWL